MSGWEAISLTKTVICPKCGKGLLVPWPEKVPGPDLHCSWCGAEYKSTQAQTLQADLSGQDLAPLTATQKRRNYLKRAKIDR